MGRKARDVRGCIVLTGAYAACTGAGSGCSGAAGCVSAGAGVSSDCVAHFDLSMMSNSEFAY
jgi:hypothetical protein